MKLKTKYPCEQCAEGTYMTVEQEWWCDKHLMYACQMERNRGLCEKFEPTSGDDAVSRKAVLDMAIVIETDDYSGNEIMKVVDTEDIKALPSVTPAPKKLKRAHWIDNHNGTISCGCCYAWFHKDDRYSYMRYCPNCGAKIVKEDKL